MHRIWLPFPDIESSFGPLPDGVVADTFLAEADWPASAAELEFLVAPYMLDPARVMERVAELPRLRVVQLLQAGYDNYLPYLPAGVRLCNAAGVHDASTAELAVSLALVANRRLDTFARQMSTGTWDQLGFTESLADKRILVIGHGRIGQAIERRLAGFEVASITRVARTARQEEVPVHAISELPELLGQADVVFVIVPLTPQTDGLIGTEELAAMPDGSLLVNVARGRVVDTDALVAATFTGRIRAALDVTDPEPLPPDHPLWTIPGVFVTPHVGGRSSAYEPRMRALVRAQLERFVAGKELANVVA